MKKIILSVLILCGVITGGVFIAASVQKENTSTNIQEQASLPNTNTNTSGGNANRNISEIYTRT